MTALPGVCHLADPRGADPARMAVAGIRVARFVARSDVDVRDWLRACGEHGIVGHLLLDEESHWRDGRRRANDEAPYLYADIFGPAANIGWVETVNEFDGSGPASSTADVADVAISLRACMRAFPRAQVITGGAVSGDPYAVEALMALLTRKEREHIWIGIHPYAQTVETIDGLLDLYRRFGRPLAITEFGWNGLGERAHAQYTEAMLRHLLQVPDVRLVEHYNWADYTDHNEVEDGAMRMGLLDLDGEPKLSYWAFQRVALEAAQRPPEGSPGRDNPTDDSGGPMKIEQLAEQYGGVWHNPNHSGPDIVEVGPGRRLCWGSATADGSWIILHELNGVAYIEKVADPNA